MRTSFVGLAALGVFVLALSAGAQAPDPFVGTWKLDTAKSKFAGPAPKSTTVTIGAAAGNTRKVAVDSVDAAGKNVKWGYTSALDGKDAMVTGNPAYDAVSGTQLNPREATVAYKKGGKTVTTLKSVVSADGKTLTNTSTPADPAAKPSVQVYTRQ